MESPVFGDLVHALRGLRHRPAFAAGIVATVAIAMGPGAAVGTVLETVLLRPLPYAESEQLVSVRTIDPGGSGSRPVTGPEVLAWIEHSTTVQSVSAVESSARTSAVVGDASGQLVTLRAVSHHFFDTLDVAPAVGLTFDAVSHPLTELGVLLSDGAWERYFGRRPDIVGQPIRFATLAGTWQVVGVMPAGFDFPTGTDMWLPTRSLHPARPSSERMFDVVARLRDGVSATQARAELHQLSGRIADTYPPGQQGWPPHVVPLSEVVTGTLSTVVVALAAAATLLLMIATANISNLVRASIEGRRTELAIRTALGASGLDLVRLCLAEVIACFLIGSAAAWILAYWMLNAIRAGLPPGVPDLLDAHASVLAVRVCGLGFLMFLIVCGSVLRGANPRSGVLLDFIRTGHYRGSARNQRAILVSQVAPALALIILSVVAGRTLWKLLRHDFGFDPHQLVMAQVRAVPDATLFFLDKTPADRERRILDGTTALLEALRAAPEISGAELINDRPFDEEVIQVSFDHNNQLVNTSRLRAWSAAYSVVSPGYFTLMDVDLVEGRFFTDADRLAPDASSVKGPFTIIVSRSLARRLWGSQPAVNRRIGTNTVVGVVEDVKFGGFDTALRPRVYYAHTQRPVSGVSIVARSSDAKRTFDRISTEARAILGPDTRVFGFTTGEAIVARWLLVQRFASRLVAILTGIAVIVATIGVCAVLASIIQRRRREFGIRLALGAPRQAIARLVLRSVALPTVLGIVLGAGLAAALERVVADLFYGVVALDAWTFGGILLAFAGAAATAVALPILNAIRTSPMILFKDGWV